MNARYTFSKEERLCHKSQIDRLFSEGRAFTISPLKVFYLVPEPEESSPVRVLIAVSSRKFKRAVDRNRLRRLIREAYRLNKNKLADLPAHVYIGFVYTGNSTDIPFIEMEKKVTGCLDKLATLLRQNSPSL